MTKDSLQYVLDRWEGEFGVVEGVGPVPRAFLPRDAREGDILVIQVEAGAVTIRLDPAARDAAQTEMQALRDSLKQAEPSDTNEFEL